MLHLQSTIDAPGLPYYVYVMGYNVIVLYTDYFP